MGTPLSYVVRPRGTLAGMASSRSPWSAVILAYALVSAGAMFLRIQLASGFGFKVFGLWQPPNSNQFRQVVGLLSISMLVLAAVLVVFVWIRFRGRPQAAATICPCYACVLYWLTVVV